MRVSQLLIAATAAVALYASNASAIFYQDDQDYTQFGATSGQLLSQGSAFADFFDIKVGTPDPGYPNGIYPGGIDTFGYVLGDTILSAFATFTFEPASLDPDFVPVPYQVQVDLGHSPAELFDRQYLIGFDTYYTSGGTLSGSLIVKLQASGRLDYQITALDGDFYLTDAALYVDTAGAYTTPDGGTTVALLGLGCLGLVGVGRRFAV